MGYGYVPVEEVQSLLREAMSQMEENNFDPHQGAKGTGLRPEAGNNYVKTTVLQQVSWQSGLPLRTIWGIMSGERARSRISTVDKIVSNLLGDPGRWQRPPLKQYYYGKW